MKRMLIDDTQPEETRVVIVDGNKVEDVEFESSCRKQIKGNVFVAKVIRVEPSLQAAFIDYGGNRHGFLAFGEIHPDYYNVSDEVRREVEAEVDESMERRKQQLIERKAEQERKKLEREERRLEYLAKIEEEKRLLEEQNANQEAVVESEETTEDTIIESQEVVLDVAIVETTDEAKIETVETPVIEIKEETETTDEAQKEAEAETTDEAEKSKPRGRRRGPRFLGNRSAKGKYKVSTDDTGINDESISCNTDQESDDDFEEDDEDGDDDKYLEIQRKLSISRKLFYRSTIQDVLKEGQTLLIQVVKEERGNKGAACTTYLSLAGRYCVLMPNRIKSGGVSRKITSHGDRKRLKDIIRQLPMNDEMSLIVRTAGEDKARGDIVRDYNYLIRTWNHIRHTALSTSAPALVYEEGNLIKRALRDMYTKDIGEVIIDGPKAYKMAKDFSRILSPNMSRKIKARKEGEIPLFQHYQIEKELDKLHNPIAQLASGGYLVINPTEALVSIDVNSGRATNEKDIEETALKTNLEAADEIAKQLRLRNLAGLIVVDFIDMSEASNNHAVEKRMKEAMKKDRSRVQIAKMSMFGLLEISRQRMHSSFIETNYITCPHCKGQGVIRTVESGAMLILHALEEEGIRANFNNFNITLPTDMAIYILNNKRGQLTSLESKYNIDINVSAACSIKNVCDYKLDRSKVVKTKETCVASASTYLEEAVEDEDIENENIDLETTPKSNDRKNRKNRRDRNKNRYNNSNDENLVENHIASVEEDSNDETLNNHKRNRNKRHRNNKYKRGDYNSKYKDNQPCALSNQEASSTDDSSKKTWWKKLVGV